MIIPNIWENKTCSKPPTRQYYSTGWTWLNMVEQKVSPKNIKTHVKCKQVVCRLTHALWVSISEKGWSLLRPSAPHICAVAKESHAVLHLINFLSAPLIGETAFIVKPYRVRIWRGWHQAFHTSISSGGHNSACQILDSQYCKKTQAHHVKCHSPPTPYQERQPHSKERNT